MIQAVCTFLSSPRNTLTSAFLLGTPSLAKYIFKDRNNRVWIWAADILMLGIAVSIREKGKMPSRNICFLYFILFTVGEAIAHYAFSQRRSSVQRRYPSEESSPVLRRSPSQESSHDEEPFFAEDLHKALVLINGASTKGSGALVHHERLGYLFLTTEHVVEPGGSAQINRMGMSLDRLKRYESGSDILLFAVAEGIFENRDKWIPRISTDLELRIGEIVYFGGYPFKETGARLHRGYISYIGENGTIGIDGVAVSGMSGGPVAVERMGKLFVVGIIASETFDPLEGFSRALDTMYGDQNDMSLRQEFAQDVKRQIKEASLTSAGFTKIPRGQLYIPSLEHLKSSDPDCFLNIWDDLNGSEVIGSDGGIDSTKVISGRLGLRLAYQQYENQIMARLRASTSSLREQDPEDIELPFNVVEPTDAINTVGLSLVQSLSTGLITAHLLQECRPVDPSKETQESAEFKIGKKKRLAKTQKKIERVARELRSERKQDDGYVNTGAPRLLYRFVSDQAAKNIKQDGIVHQGGALDEVPFLTAPYKPMAESVGAVTIEKLVTVFTDRIPELAKENVRRVSERNGIITYRINRSIPADAIAISEA